MAGSMKVGVIGANPERGWALAAHLPALQAMPDFEIAAVSTTRQETADESAARFGAARAYVDWRRLVEDPDVEIVAICVKVAHHREMALAAIGAGKHVFCEWPLGLDTGEAEDIRDAAARAGVLNVVGLQGRASPYLCAVRDLVAEGAVGEVISATLVSSLATWGPRLPASEIYRTKRESGATGLTVPGGHSLDSLCHCVGEFRDVQAVVTTQHKTCQIVGTQDFVEVTAPDQVLVTGTLASGAVASVHIKADIANPLGVRLEINGTEGDILLTTREPAGPAPVGIQRAELDLRVARGRKKAFADITDFERYRLAPAGVPAGPPFFTAQLYRRLADAIAGGAAPDPGFDAAVRRHRMLDAVQRSSDTGTRQAV